MANTKERLDDLESGLGMVQDELQKMTTGIADKFRNMESSFNRTLEDSMNRMMEMMNQTRGDGSNNSRENRRPSMSSGSSQRSEHTNPFAAVPHRHNIKLDFPRFNGGDPTEWISKAKQYFAYQEMPEEQRVSFASYHLTDEANEWWQATSKAIGADPNHTPWDVFEAELWIRFGPTEGENFHEALSKIRQTGTLREYQREFERLQNKVTNWSEEALVGTFLGGLKESIADNVRMFTPKTLKAVINLARLSDGQEQKKKNPCRPYTPSPSSSVPSQPFPPRESAIITPKKLTWDEMKRKRSLGLCFSCDERYGPGHRCRQSQLLLMEGDDTEDEDNDGDNDQLNRSFPTLNLEAKVLFDGEGNDEVAGSRNSLNRRTSNRIIKPNRKYQD